MMTYKIMIFMKYCEPLQIEGSIDIFVFGLPVIDLSNTVFRQAFLLIQYSFIFKQYVFCSDREYQYFF